MNGFTTNIERDALANEHFRRVLFTGTNMQLVLMTLQPGEDIGEEAHKDHDQFFRVEAGRGVARLNGEERRLEEGSVVLIPAGVEHNILNTSKDEQLRLYTLYAPPQHADGTVHHTKGDATLAERH